MKRTSWRAIPAHRDRGSTLPRSPRSTNHEAGAPDATLKPTPEPGDLTNVHPSRTHLFRTTASTRTHATPADPAGTAVDGTAPRGDVLAAPAPAPAPTPGAAAPARSRRRGRRLLAIIPAAIATAALAGCFTIIGQTTVQDGDIGDVLVTTDMCLTSGQAGCAGGLTDTTHGNVQYLFGYLIPTWAQEPESFQWNGDAGNLTVSRNIAYENILQGFAPAPLGLHWIGYGTSEQPAPPINTDQRMRASARIGIPDSAPANLQLAMVSGWRVVRDSAGGTRTALAIDRAFNCNEQTDGEPTTQCVLSGEPTQSTTPGQTPAADDIALNTLSIGQAPAANVRAGSTVTMRFPQTSNYSGSGNDTIPMKVTTTLKGAKIEAPPAIILGSSALPAEVRITAPLIAETGDYTVTLATANGIRKGTGQLHVTGIRSLLAPPTSSTVKTLKDGVAALKAYLKTAKSTEIRRGNTFDLPVALPSAGTLTGTLKGGRQALSAGKSTLKIPGTASLHLVPNSRAQKLLRSGRALSGKLTFVFKPKSGKTQTATLSVRLK